MIGARPLAAAQTTTAQDLAAETLGHLVEGREDAARATYDALVVSLQRRASRLAYCYLRDAADTDDAVQDAFVKAYLHLRTYRDDLPFEAWFTRILVNGCLDRLKGRRRRWQWIAPLDASGHEDRRAPRAAEASPEEELIASERRGLMTAAIGQLPDKQRTVMLLTHVDGRTPKEISAITGMSESTIRVHQFRAIRRLRAWMASATATPAEADWRRAEA